jgi:hypothetical protein
VVSMAVRHDENVDDSQALGTDGPGGGTGAPGQGARSAGQTSETQDRFPKTGDRLDGRPVRQPQGPTPPVHDVEVPSVAGPNTDGGGLAQRRV